MLDQETIEIRISMCKNIRKMLDEGYPPLNIAYLYGFKREEVLWEMLSWAKKNNYIDDFKDIRDSVDKKKCLIC